MDSNPSNTKKGALYVLGAFSMWGLFPIYFKSLQNVGALEMLCHRVVWSVPLTALLLTFVHDWGGLRRSLKNRRVIATLLLTSSLVASNWGVFIYAITTGRVLQSSIGYFINPLINVLLGTILLRESLRPAQAAAVLLAAAGTVNLAWAHGSLPWISLALAFTFAFYGFLRKTVRIESLEGLFVETTLLCPLALGYLIYLAASGQIAFGTAGPRTTWLLVAAGLVNSLPLLLFTSGARRIPYSLVGLIQYLTPTLHFILAVFVYGEAFTTVHKVTFGLIWTGIAIFVADSLYLQRKYRLLKIPAA